MLGGLRLSTFLKQSLNCRCWPAAFSWTKALLNSTKKPKAGPCEDRRLERNWKDQSPDAAPQLIAADLDVGQSYAKELRRSGNHIRLCLQGGTAR